MSESVSGGSQEQFDPFQTALNLFRMHPEELRLRFQAFGRAAYKLQEPYSTVIEGKVVGVESFFAPERQTDVMVTDGTKATRFVTTKEAVRLYADYDNEGNPAEWHELENQDGEYGAVPLIKVNMTHLTGLMSAEHDLMGLQQRSTLRKRMMNKLRGRVIRSWAEIEPVNTPGEE